ncbi:gas vesicle protein GvpK [Natronococcus occultus]|uniref:Gas vesicle protein K n=1 Tax=Natronococcus occultus SP4 TaxID=694430 RepID=L0K662_9EURY|nr:gas vesicle protein GvpK [Natronococcus occultus]AGB39844.1 Gas vesicle protein K [Natronococcus occultus SP4]
MTIEVDEEELEQGLLGLIMALVEIIKEVIDQQALELVESGVLDDESAEQLGQSLRDLEETIQQIEEEQNVEETASETKEQLDRTVDDVLNTALNPAEWAREIEAQEQRGFTDGIDDEPVADSEHETPATNAGGTEE